jgi:hypothetical protein
MVQDPMMRVIEMMKWRDVSEADLAVDQVSAADRSAMLRFPH